MGVSENLQQLHVLGLMIRSLLSEGGTIGSICSK